MRAAAPPQAPGLVRRALVASGCWLAVGGLVAGSAGCGGAEPDAAPRRAPNVVLFVIDTLRSDRLGAYGSTKGLTRHIDELAAESWVFDNAVAQSSWTRPSVLSIFSGMRPLQHGVTRLDKSLSTEVVTVTEALSAHGYATAGFSTNHNASGTSGITQGFDEFVLIETQNWPTIFKPMRRWLRRAATERPFFLYVHILDPHSPYDPPAEYRTRFASGVRRTKAGELDERTRLMKLPVAEREPFLGDLRDLYDAEVAAADEAVGVLTALLRRQERWNDTLFVLVSDHGEEFNEHGWLDHGNNLHTETVDVPLLLKLPRGVVNVPPSAGRSALVADHTDLLPTILAACGVAAPPGLPGIDLVPELRRPVPAERFAISHLGHRGKAWLGVTSGRYRYLRPIGRGDLQAALLYDRVEDRAERRSIAATNAAAIAELEEILAEAIRRDRAAAVTPAESTADDEVKKRLQALGYLGS